MLYQVKSREKHKNRALEVTNHGLRLNILIFIFDTFAVQVDDMTEKKTAIKLTAETKSVTVAADQKRCIICQKLTPEPTTSTENGRKRVRQAASIREDVVSITCQISVTELTPGSPSLIKSPKASQLRPQMIPTGLNVMSDGQAAYHVRNQLPNARFTSKRG